VFRVGKKVGIIKGVSMAKRHKTEYPGVFYRMVNRRGKPGKMQKVFYIVFKQDGKVFEEKVGLQYEDAMTPAKSSRIRAQRIEKKGFPQNNAEKEKSGPSMRSGKNTL